MKKVLKEIEVYEFYELCQESKDRAINEYINFILEVTPYEEMSVDMKKACMQAEKNKTPWFTGSYVWEYCQEDILFVLNDDQQYLKNGALFLQ